LLEAPLAFSLAGDGYLVDSDDAPLLAELSRWAGPLRGPIARDALHVRMRTRGEGAPCLDLWDEQRFCHEATEDLLPALEGLIYDRLDRPGRGLTVVHAAVAARGKRAVLFTGESGAGKSVLSLRLARRGWTYVSDDLAPIDDDGNVLAVPRPVTFEADEIDGALWRDISHDCASWEASYRTPEGARRTVLHACPAGAAESGLAFEIAAVYRLQPRGGRAPLLHRMPGPEARAWIFALRATRRADSGVQAATVARS
jgi:hypothetical protein